MSGAKMRHRAPTPTVWRERASAADRTTQRVWAQRAGFDLEIVIRRVSETRVTLDVVVKGGGRYVPYRLVVDGEITAHRVNAQLDVAKAWAEQRADELRDARGAE